MKKMKYLRTWLVAALVVTIIGSLTGGTVAWFTDEETSTGNIIETGTLDIKLSVEESVESEDGTITKEWTEVTDNSPALFNYNLWEPGYTEVRKVKIENEGNLALQYRLNVKPAIMLEFADENSTLLQDTITLAKEIEVYMAPDADYTSFTALKEACGADYVAPTLYDMFMSTDPDGVAYGVMLPDGKEIPADAPAHVVNAPVEWTIALHMKETAGNECQGISVGEGFVIELRATQYTYEADSFGIDYDADASNDLPSAFVKMLTAEQLAEIADPALDVGYLFATTELPETAATNSYKDWHVDYTVTFDKDVTNEIALAGFYEIFSENWISIPVEDVLEGLAEMNVIPDSTKIPAGTPVRLLGEAAAALVNHPINFSYEDMCNGVINFYCGAYDTTDGAAAGITMTVSLSLYENATDESNNDREEETGRSVSIGTFTYTFPAAE